MLLAPHPHTDKTLSANLSLYYRYTYLVSAADKRPVRLSFVGHNTVTNSHFDNYTFDVLQVRTAPPIGRVALSFACL